MKHFLSSLRSAFRKPQPRAARLEGKLRARLNLECLEGRVLMSATPPTPSPIAPTSSVKVVLRANTDLYLDTAHTQRAWFPAGTTVVERPDGSVFSGELEYNSDLFINTAHSLRTWFQPGETVFNPDGSVFSGELEYNTYEYINSAHTLSAMFQAVDETVITNPGNPGASGGTLSLVEFRPDGSAWYGTLENNAYEYINSAHTLGSWFDAGYGTTFLSSGAIFAGVLENNTYEYVNTAHTLWECFQAGTSVGFNPDGDGSVNEGTLAYTAWLYTNQAHTQWSEYAAGTSISFRTDGSVLASSTVSW